MLKALTLAVSIGVGIQAWLCMLASGRHIEQWPTNVPPPSPCPPHFPSPRPTSGKFLGTPPPSLYTCICIVCFCSCHCLSFVFIYFPPFLCLGLDVIVYIHIPNAFCVELTVSAYNFVVSVILQLEWCFVCIDQCLRWAVWCWVHLAQMRAGVQ